MKLIVGLGNHGSKYEHTRHNIGWDAVVAFAKEHGGSFQEKKDFKAEIAEIRIQEEKILLVLPLTYMNGSGDAVQAIAHYYKIKADDILITQDEMDFELGRFAFIGKGRAAGHNGIRSIQETLGTEEIDRLRIGIGRPTTPIEKEDFVLQRFSKEEQNIVNETLEKTKGAIMSWIIDGLEKTMNQWHGIN